MADLAGFPSAEILYRGDGSVDGSDAAARALAADAGITDLLLLTHGWNNTADDARGLFRAVAASLRAVANQGHGLPAGRSLGIVGVIWPSQQFAMPSLAAGPAAAAGSPVTAQDVVDQIDLLRTVFPDEQARLDQAAHLVPRLADKASARRGFADLVRGLLVRDDVDTAEAPTTLFTMPGDVMIERLAIPDRIPGPSTGGGPALAVGGPAAGLFGLPGGFLGGALKLLNLATYYTMKDRSATVGTVGLAPLVTAVSTARPALRVHLAGHSFGARLVSATAKALPAGTTVASMALLQGAFSHFGFSDDWDPDAPGTQQGFFRTDVADKKVSGPVVVTHTANDVAVGIAYAAASRLANQVASGLGGPDDIYGGLGRNGAQRTAEAVAGTLLPVGGGYSWQAHRPHNLLADAFIKGHSDVTGAEVAYALLSAAAAT